MKLCLTALCLFTVFSPLIALSVDEEEIKSKSGITFINSPDQRGSDTLTAIKGIGKNLASAGKAGSYSIIHATGAGDEKFDADIIVIGANARVNHIKNVRRIIASYLESRYEYSAEDAKSLALMAIEEARNGNFEQAEKNLAEAREQMAKAHDVQNDMLQSEAQGKSVELNIVLIHAEDHLTMAIMSIDFAEEFIELYKQNHK